MTNKHTSGPWMAKNDPVTRDNGDVVGFYSITGPDLTHVCYVTDTEYRTGDLGADARLIAAAPELLKAAEGLASDVQCLVDCRSDCGDYGSECLLQDAHKPDSTIERLQRLLDAIAKAKGE